MANGKKSFLDHFRISDEDDDDYEDEDDYIFDDEEDDYEEPYRKKRPSTEPVKQSPSKTAFTPARESKPSFAPQRETRKSFSQTQTAGELRAISANIFIAVPSNIEVSGDLREEILNNTGGLQY